jgi:tRNA(Ile)-lysidine synthase
MSDRRIRDLIESALADLAPGAILVAHSGGLDSTVLLHALAHAQGAGERALRPKHVHRPLHRDGAYSQLRAHETAD